MTLTRSETPNEVRADDAAVLSVRGLSVEFRTELGTVTVVEDVSFDIARGETVGLVGESGSGKTMTARAIMGLVPEPNGRISRGEVHFGGRDLATLGQRELSSIRGREISMIFQEPLRSLNPAYTVGDQIAEMVRRHRNVSRQRAWRRAVETLDMVGIPSAPRRSRDYPHQFSGGMCQRVMLAMALSCEPRLLIADEPTTALDVTVQAQVLRLIQDLQSHLGISVLLITHDLGVVAEMCDRVAVMYAGQIVEAAGVDVLFRQPTHPYSAGLLASVMDVLVDTDDQRSFGSIRGSVPPPHQFPDGCRFHPRCDHAEAGRCNGGAPDLVSLDRDRWTRCVRADELELRGVPDD